MSLIKLLIDYPSISVRIIDYLFISDLRVILQLLPCVKKNLSRLQREKLNFFSLIFKSNNDWNHSISDIFDRLINETSVKDKNEFMRLMNENSIFEHFAYCCQERYCNSYYPICKKCRLITFVEYDEQHSFMLTQFESDELQKYFKCSNIMDEFQDGYNFLNPYV